MYWKREWKSLRNKAAKNKGVRKELREEIKTAKKEGLRKFVEEGEDVCKIVRVAGNPWNLRERCGTW